VAHPPLVVGPVLLGGGRATKAPRENLAQGRARGLLVVDHRGGDCCWHGTGEWGWGGKARGARPAGGLDGSVAGGGDAVEEGGLAQRQGLLVQARNEGRFGGGDAREVRGFLRGEKRVCLGFCGRFCCRFGCRCGVLCG
jgi:hypothetical protein